MCVSWAMPLVWRPRLTHFSWQVLSFFTTTATTTHARRLSLTTHSLTHSPAPTHLLPTVDPREWAMRLLPGVLLLCAYTAVITVALLPLHYAQHHPLPHSLTHKGTGEEESFLLPLPLQHWVPLSEDSLLAWYPRSIEQCMLRNHTTETDVKALYVVSADCIFSLTHSLTHWLFVHYTLYTLSVSR
jgi:hypothetical protein